MITKYFGDKLRKAKSSERAEAMPAAIITAIVSSLLLLGIASTVALVVESKGESESNVQLTTAASNIDVSLRSDVTNASYISASAKLKQPAGRLLTPTDVTVTGVKMHIPATDGGCKVVRWTVDGSAVSRQLTIYKLSSTDSGTVTCDENSGTLAERKKVFAQDVNVNAPFAFHNQVGRSIVFNHANASLETANSQLDAKLKSLNVQKLNDEDFSNLNKLMKGDSFVAAFADPTACPMNAPRGAAGACPAPESDTIVAAWDSLKIAKVSVDFSMTSPGGDSVNREIEQNSSVPLYRNAAEAEAAVAGVARGNKPAAPVASISTDKVVLGENYTVNWSTSNLTKCPANTEQTFNVYENGKLVKTTTDIKFAKAHTVSTDQYVEYTIQVECARGALLVTSDLSNNVKARVIPAAPVLNITKQPAATNVPLDAEIAADGKCLYGTTVSYTVIQIENSYAPGGKKFNFIRLGSAMTLPIDGLGNFPVVEGARYKYRVEANCSNTFGDVSTITTKETNPFTTVITPPSPTTVFTSPDPSYESMKVAQNTTLTWTTATCKTGATPQYFVQKNVNNGAFITPQTVVNWVNQTSAGTNNNQGSYVGYTVAAKCAGTAVDSTPSPTNQVRYTTKVDAPAALWAHNDGGTWVGVDNPVVCAPGTEGQYRRVQTMQDGRGVALYGGWNTSRSEPLPGASNGGYPQGAFVESRCVGPNDLSATTGGANTTKWVKPFDIWFVGNMDWRRLNVDASCPAHTRLENFYLYVAADGWGGARATYGIQTDEGHWINDTYAGGGGNSGWVQMNTTQNTQWIHTTANWGINGRSGWGSRVDGNYMYGTYWNSGGWGNFAYWWYGSCVTDYMKVGAKNSYWQGGGIRNVGDPGARYNGALSGRQLTTAGQNAIR